MALWVTIYLWGIIAALLLLFFIVKDSEDSLEWYDFWLTLLLCVMSWSTVMGMLFRYVIKFNENQE